MKDWDITHRTSSAYFPHSNIRAETAVQFSKRMLQDSVSRAGSINNDKFVNAILQYPNTSHQDCRRSPAQMVFGRTLRDHIPCLPYKYAANTDWCVSQELKEWMMTKSREVDGEKLARNTRHLQNLPIGTPVAIHKQSGRYPTKWDKTGVIMEVRPHKQIVAKVDGRRRLTIRNRRFANHCQVWHPITEAKTREDEALYCDTALIEPAIHNANTLTAHSGDLFPAQIGGGDDQHDGGEDYQLHDEPVPEATLVDDTEARPIRKKKPNKRGGFRGVLANVDDNFFTLLSTIYNHWISTKSTISPWN
jgi:hypothetical protein